MTLAEAGQGIKGYDSVKVNRGHSRTTPIAPSTKAVAVVPSNSSKQSLQYTYTPAKGVKKNTVEAPVKKVPRLRSWKLAPKVITLALLAVRQAKALP